MPPLTIKAPAYAASLGITPRALLDFINKEKMPGARKAKRIWRINPAIAEPWLKENHPKLFASSAISIPIKSATDNAQAEALPETELELTDRHIRRLNASLEGMVTVLHGGDLDRNLVHSIKQLSGELRLLEKHRLEMRKSNDELMTRQEHHLLVAKLARIIASEIDGLGNTIPEELLSAMTDAGCTISKPKTALKAVTATAHEESEKLRHRIADAIDKSTIGDNENA